MHMNSVRTCISPRMLSAFTFIFSCWGAPVLATEPLPAAQGRVVLTVTGNIVVTNTPDNLDNNTGNKAEFDLDMLAQLPQHEFSTETPWTEGVHHFHGVLLKDVLQRVGAKSSVLRAVALNEYYYEMDTSSLGLEHLLLVTHLDGKAMKIRDKGPIWLMLPLSELQQLDKKQYHELLVWQLKKLDVRYSENF